MPGHVARGRAPGQVDRAGAGPRARRAGQTRERRRRRAPARGRRVRAVAVGRLAARHDGPHDVGEGAAPAQPVVDVRRPADVGGDEGVVGLGTRARRPVHVVAAGPGDRVPGHRDLVGAGGGGGGAGGRQRRDAAVATVEGDGSRTQRVEPVAETSGIGAAAGPRSGEAAVVIGKIRGTACRGTAMELADVAALLRVQRRSGRSGLGDAEVGAPDRVDVAAVAGHRRRPSAALCRPGGEGDPHFLGSRMVDGDRRGELRRVGRAVPAPEEHVEGRRERVVQLHEGEVGRRVAGAEERPGVELAQAAVPGRALPRALRPAEGVEVVEVGDERGRVARVDAAMERGHEEAAGVVGGVVDQRAAANAAAAQRDSSRRALLVVVGVADRAHDVDVAGAGLLHVRLAEAAVVVIHHRQVKPEPDPPRVRDRHLEHALLTEDDGRPELPVVLVVLAGERPVDVLPVRRVDEETAVGGHREAIEPEVQGARVLGVDTQPPEQIPVVQALPRSRGLGSDVDLHGRGKPQELLPGGRQVPLVLVHERLGVHGRQGDPRHRIEGLDALGPGGRLQISGRRVRDRRQS